MNRQTIWTILSGGVIAVAMAACTPKTVSSHLQSTRQIDIPVLPDSVQQLYNHLFLDAMAERQKGNSDAAFDLLNHCLEINPYAAESYYFLAQYYAILRQSEKSIDYFKQAALLNPDNETYMETLAQVYIRQQNYEDAIHVVEQLYNNNKDREDLLEMLFQLHLQVDNYTEALRVLNLMEEIDGKNERISKSKSEIYTLMGDHRAAVAELAELARQYPNDLNYQALYGETLMMNGQPERALDIYNRILQESPDNNRVLLSMRTYYQAIGDSLQADSLTQRVLLSKNASAEDKIKLIRQEIGASERSGGDSTRVLSLFRRIFSINDQDADMAMFCASYMEMKHMPADTIGPVLRRVLDIQPDNAAARLRLVGYALEQENMDSVINLCQLGRLYNPDELTFYFYEGLVHHQKDDTDAALSVIRSGVNTVNSESEPGMASDLYLELGDLLHKKGLADEAYAAYDSCLQWRADNIPCLNNYAYYLSEKGQQLERAEQMSYKTIKAEPKNATYLDTYAWILFMQQRYTEAKVYIDQALQHMEILNSRGDSIDNGTLYHHAGDIYWHCNDQSAALDYWQEALRTDKENKTLIRKIKLKKYIKE